MVKLNCCSLKPHPQQLRFIVKALSQEDAALGFKKVNDCRNCKKSDKMIIYLLWLKNIY